MKNERLIAEAKSSFAEVVDEIRIYERVCNGGGIYAPHGSPTDWESSQLTLEPRSEIDGRLMMNEAVVVLLLHNIIRVKSKQMAKNYSEARAVKESLELSEEDSLQAVLSGMEYFVRYLSFAAGVREAKCSGKKRPAGGTMRDRANLYWWNHFERPLEEDDYLLGQAVALETVRVVEELADRNLKSGIEPGSWRDGARKGAEMAASVYIYLLGADLAAAESDPRLQI